MNPGLSLGLDTVLVLMLLEGVLQIDTWKIVMKWAVEEIQVLNLI